MSVGRLRWVSDEYRAVLASDNVLENLRHAVERELQAGVSRERIVAQLEELRVDLRRTAREDDEDVVLEVTS